MGNSGTKEEETPERKMRQLIERQSEEIRLVKEEKNKEICRQREMNNQLKRQLSDQRDAARNQCIFFVFITLSGIFVAFMLRYGQQEESSTNRWTDYNMNREKEESCTNQWTNHSVNTLKRSLDSYLFGQHLVNNIVYKAISGHLKHENPKKALVLSFHGWPGTGKNYVSDFIVEHVFKKGIESKYFHKFVTTKHFSNKDELSIKEYKELIKIEIESKVTMCPRSMFVFDEIDKMPKGLSDILVPYLDFHPQLDGIDYRKAIFIFLSNTGGDIINTAAWNHFIAGKSREAITSKQMEEVLSARVLYNKEGGLQDSELILRSFVDFYIPFLPLERQHVKQCAEVAIKQRNGKVEADVLDCVSNEIQYFPTDRPLFSQSGCKQVEKKVDICL